MTRRDTAGIGSNYSSRPPSPHSDTPHHQRQPLSHTSPPLVCDDTSLPQGMRTAVLTPVPTRTKWIRECYFIQPSVTGIQGFAGNYIETDANAAYVRPGSLLIVCQGQPYNRGDDSVVAYILLPENIWYPIPDASFVRVPGWHRPMHARLQGWAAMSRMQRVMTACAEAVTELRAASHNAADRERGDANDAVAQLNGITDRILNSVSNHSMSPADTMRRLFADWLRTVALTTASTPEVVMEVIGRRIASVLTPSANLSVAEGMLADEEYVRALRGRDLTHARRLVSGMSSNLQDEHDRRRLVLTFVHYLDSRGLVLSRSTAAMVTLIGDREVSDLIIRSDNYGLARRLRDEHDISLSRVVTNAALGYMRTLAEVEASTQTSIQVPGTAATIQTEAERPAIENRRIRNIHINRRSRDE